MSSVRPTIPTYQPALAWGTAIGSAWVFVLVMMGAFTTSIGAGMVFPDWPLSNGSLNPDGWLSDIAMFAEHSHRLSAAMMSLITVAIAVAVWKRDPRRWLRRLGVGAVALVLVQALVGGLRVLLDHWHVEMVNTSVGRLFAMVHAGLAQIFVCTLLAIAVALSRPWLQRGTAGPAFASSLRRLGLLSCGLLLVQLAIAAVMRHSFAGLAIATFPWSTPEGGLLPAAWDFRVGIHFAHRAMALILTVALVLFAVRLWRARAAGAGVKLGAGLMMALLGLQIYLGAAVIWTGRNPYLTTWHVIVGACTLAVTFGLTWWIHREAIDPAVLETPNRHSPRRPALMHV